MLPPILSPSPQEHSVTKFLVILLQTGSCIYAININKLSGYTDIPHIHFWLFFHLIEYLGHISTAAHKAHNLPSFPLKGWIIVFSSLLLDHLQFVTSFCYYTVFPTITPFPPQCFSNEHLCVLQFCNYKCLQVYISS